MRNREGNKKVANIICLNEASIKHDLYGTDVKTVVDLNNTKRIYINFEQVLGMQEKVYKTGSGEDVNVTSVMFISGGSVDVLDSVHEIMQRVKSVERKKYETRTA